MEGDSLEVQKMKIEVGISIHSLRMEGDEALSPLGEKFGISIHSLRMEGDAFILTGEKQNGNFNPLPPHGGRPVW